MTLTAGVDEAGRGPLAGPVIAAAVILPADHELAGLTDSKKLTPRRREALAVAIREQAVAWALGRAEVAEIDRINILQASLLAMRRALDGLAVMPGEVRVDGNQCPGWRLAAQTIVGGDLLEPAISAASVLAKVTRDREMVALAERYPGYGFEGHKGYPSPGHLQALQELGVTPEHRRSYAPVRRLIEQTHGHAGV